MVDCLSHEVVTSGQSYQFTDFTVTTLDVTHETGTLGFLIENQRRVAYLPDTGPLPLEAQKQIQGVDVLILGAPFWKENWLPDTHLTVDEAIQQGQAVGAGEIILTHLSMHYSEPITAEELDDYLKQFGNVRLGYDGLRLLI
jgi:phosphoribosyl 1,2-cyclic phosphate phosphodiesterase